MNPTLGMGSTLASRLNETANGVWAIETEAEHNQPALCRGDRTLPTGSATLSYDRRRFTRYKVPLGVVLRQESHDAPLYVNVSDASAGGCYVETILPWRRGTQLSIVIWLESNKLETKGIVRTSDPGVGMGIEFLDMEAAKTERLDRFLQARDELNVDSGRPPFRPLTREATMTDGV